MVQKVHTLSDIQSSRVKALSYEMYERMIYGTYLLIVLFLGWELNTKSYFASNLTIVLGTVFSFQTQYIFVIQTL